MPMDTMRTTTAAVAAEGDIEEGNVNDAEEALLPDDDEDDKKNVPMSALASSMIIKSKRPSAIPIPKNYDPQGITKELQRTINWYQSCKVAIGVLMTSAVALIPSINDATNGTGGWSIITVLIVMSLSTPGEIMNKMMNRTVGTIVGALAATAVGLVVAKQWIVPHTSYAVGAVALGAVNVLVAFVTTRFANMVHKTWSYALLLGCFTFCFISITTFYEDADDWTGLWRIAMIVGGGVVGVVLTWIPPHVWSADVARAHLIESAINTAVCLHELLNVYTGGTLLMVISDENRDENQHPNRSIRDKSTKTEDDTSKRQHHPTLHSLYDIYGGRKDDDLIHQSFKQVILARTSLEAAIQHSKYEFHQQQVQDYAAFGRAIRFTIRSVVAADMTVREPDFCPLLLLVDDDAVDEPKKNKTNGLLLQALEQVACGIYAELTTALSDGLDFTDVPEFMMMAATTNAGGSLETALLHLEKQLQTYITSHYHYDDNAAASFSSNERMMESSQHIAFARLLLVAGRQALGIQPTILGRTEHSSSSSSSSVALTALDVSTTLDERRSVWGQRE